MGMRRQAAEVARDRRKIAELYLAGWLQVDIAEKVGRAQPTVSRDLKALHQEWLADGARDFATAKARELAEIDNLEREYWRAWRASCEDAETVTEKGRGGSGRVTSGEKTVQRKGQSGNSSFLTGIQWCIERRCKILGVDAPVKTNARVAGQVGLDVTGEMTLKGTTIAFGRTSEDEPGPEFRPSNSD